MQVPTFFWAKWGFYCRPGVDQELLESLWSQWLPDLSGITGGYVMECAPDESIDYIDGIKFTDNAHGQLCIAAEANG